MPMSLLVQTASPRAILVLTTAASIESPRLSTSSSCSSLSVGAMLFSQFRFFISRDASRPVCFSIKALELRFSWWKFVCPSSFWRNDSKRNLGRPSFSVVRLSPYHFSPKSLLLILAWYTACRQSPPISVGLLLVANVRSYRTYRHSSPRPRKTS